MNRNNEQMLLMYFRFACSRDIFRCNHLLYGTGPFWKNSGSLSKELDLLLILNNQTFSFNVMLEQHVLLFSRLSPMLYLEQTNLSNIFFTTKHLIWRPLRPRKQAKAGETNQKPHMNLRKGNCLTVGQHLFDGLANRHFLRQT